MPFSIASVLVYSDMSCTSQLLEGGAGLFDKPAKGLEDSWLAGRMHGPAGHGVGSQDQDREDHCI